ncbi:MAG: exodeoxyribonuclease VII large subunit [Faecalibacterium prausnitzii]
MAEVITVSALNQYVKTLLDANDILFDLALRGEIANFVQNARSGHCYFSLRDASASVKAVMFRSDARRLGFRPEEGMKVVVRCRATLYERDGAFQIYVNEMFPDGIGAAQLAFEQLKARLEQEGLLRQSTKAAARVSQMHRRRHQQDRRGIAGHSQCHWSALACGKTPALPGQCAGL